MLRVITMNCFQWIGSMCWKSGLTGAHYEKSCLSACAWTCQGVSALCGPSWETTRVKNWKNGVDFAADTVNSSINVTILMSHHNILWLAVELMCTSEGTLFLLYFLCLQWAKERFYSQMNRFHLILSRRVTFARLKSIHVEKYHRTSNKM